MRQGALKAQQVATSLKRSKASTDTHMNYIVLTVEKIRKNWFYYILFYPKMHESTEFLL